MEEVRKIINDLTNSRLVNSIIIIIVSLILYKIIILLINKGEDKSKLKLFTSSKGKTYVKLMISVVRYVFLILTILLLLQVNGINVSSVIAGVGIFGVIFGFAIQDWLKDIIRGSSIISDEYFSVGDIVKYKDIEGKVIVIGLKTTKIQELKTSNIVSIANRNIEEVEVVSNFVYVRVPMPYDLKLVDAERVIGDITNSIKHNNNVYDCTYKGVTEFQASSIEYLLEVNCNQTYKLQVRRDALRSILAELEKNNIEIPFTQIDIHNK